MSALLPSLRVPDLSTALARVGAQCTPRHAAAALARALVDLARRDGLDLATLERQRRRAELGGTLVSDLDDFALALSARRLVIDDVTLGLDALAAHVLAPSHATLGDVRVPDGTLPLGALAVHTFGPARWLVRVVDDEVGVCGLAPRLDPGLVLAFDEMAAGLFAELLPGHPLKYRDETLCVLDESGAPWVQRGDVSGWGESRPLERARGVVDAVGIVARHLRLLGGGGSDAGHARAALEGSVPFVFIDAPVEIPRGALRLGT